MPIRLSVSNFGPVREGCVEVKPVTIFIGPNNTGKSFYSTFVYAALAANPRPRRIGSRFYPDDVAPEAARPESTQEALAELATEILGSPGRDLPAAHVENHQKEALLSIVDRLLEGYARRVSIELERCLGGRLNTLRRESAPEDLPLRLAIEEPGTGWRVEITCNRDDPDFRVTRHPDFNAVLPEFVATLDEVIGFFESLDPPHVPLKNSERYIHELVELVTEHFLLRIDGVIFAGFPRMRHYLPAARSGILQGHKTLAAFLVNSAPLVGLQRMELPQLSGVVTDFISSLLTLDRRREQAESGLDGVARQLEEDILAGKVRIEGERNTYPEIFYDVGNLHVPLVRTSSIVSELAPVILFLRYLVRPGDHLVIEEPESHLHPQSQRAFARAFGKLRGHNVSILLTTHSDYLLTEINNLIRSAALADRSDVRPPGVTLPAGDVGAYLFVPDEGNAGTVVKPLQVTETEGVPDEEFGRVAEAIYDEATDLRYRLIEAGSADSDT